MHIYELSYQSDFLLCEIVSAWQLSVQSDVIKDGCGCVPLWALAVHRTSHA